MSDETVFEKLRILAGKYETSGFINADPCQFTRRYKNRTDCEAASFVAAMLSFGNRKQFIPKIDFIFQTAGEKFSDWILDGRKNTLGSEEDKCGDGNEVSNPQNQFGSGNEISSSHGHCGCGCLKSPTGNNNDKFYRFYSYNDMNDLFEELAAILRKWGSLGECVRQKWITECDAYDDVSNPKRQAGGGRRISQTDGSIATVYLDTIIASIFPKSRIVAKGRNSANKRTNMFLRWMVRRDSPVDLGLWDWYSPADLLMPLDVHVMQESVELGLLPENAKADRKTAIFLTNKMKEIWADDPCKGDFALFGMGVQ